MKLYYHQFDASRADALKCKVCQFTEVEHVCCICSATLVGTSAGTLWCEVCWDKELAAQVELESMASARVEEVKNRIPTPDTSIVITTDIFNAKIAAIEDIRKEIDADDSITNKQFALAQRIEARFLHFQKVLADSQAAVKDSSQEIRTIQTYYNELAKKLKAEEREKIRIEDAKYTPPEKPVKAPKVPSVKKYSDKEIREASGISNIPERILKLMCYSQNISVREAIQQYAQVMSAKKG